MHVCACEPCVFVVYTCIIGCMEDHVETVVSRDGPLLDIRAPVFTPVIDRGLGQWKSSGSHGLTSWRKIWL